MKESNKATPRLRMRIVWTGEHWYLLGAGNGDFQMEKLAYESGYRVSIFCQLAGCGGGYLKEVFLRDMGILPKRWLSELRMVVARRMLRGLRRPPKVAKLLGFARRVISRANSPLTTRPLPGNTNSARTANAGFPAWTSI